MNIVMIPIEKSSNVKAIGWVGNVIYADSGIARDVLRVEFTSGMMYDYLNVSEEVWKKLLQAESKGSFLHRNIYDKYSAVKLA